MQVYIKNNKRGIPSFIQQNVTLILLNETVVGKIYFRTTTTRRQVGNGQNHWDLFFIEIFDGYRVYDSSSFILGRRDGIDYGFSIHRVLRELSTLPNGTELPAQTQEVNDSIVFLPVMSSYEDIEECVRMTPFHQPGGKDSRLEIVDIQEMWDRDSISWYVRNKPDGRDFWDDITRRDNGKIWRWGEYGQFARSEGMTPTGLVS